MSTTWAERLKSAWRPRTRRAPLPTAPGVYHFPQLRDQWPTRFHLRVDTDGGGLLLANAAEAASLSPVGVLMARLLLEGGSDAAVTAAVAQAFPGGSPEQVSGDLAQVKALLTDLATPGDNYPVTNPGGDLGAGAARALLAPLRADLVPGDPAEARTCLRALWEAGVPHATLLPPAGYDARALVALVETTEDLGMICGLRTVASWLPPEVVHDAAHAGLDHLDLAFAAPWPEGHDPLTAPGDLDRVLSAFSQCHELELCPVAEVPLHAGNAPRLPEILLALQRCSVTNLIAYALAAPDEDAAAQAAGALPARALPQIAVSLTEAAEQSNCRYLWAPPVRFDSALGLAEHVRRGPRTAGDVAVRVEAEGSVFPPRGPRACAGNLLREPWSRIWAQPCFARYRERFAAPRCAECPDLDLCVGGCVKDPAGWSDDRPGGEAR